MASAQSSSAVVKAAMEARARRRAVNFMASIDGLVLLLWFAVCCSFIDGVISFVRL